MVFCLKLINKNAERRENEVEARVISVNAARISSHQLVSHPINEDDLKNEDDTKKEDDLKTRMSSKIKITSNMKSAPPWVFQGYFNGIYICYL